MNLKVFTFLMNKIQKAVLNIIVKKDKATLYTV